MRFFEQQKVDAIGLASVKLQKVLLFLLIVNFIGVLFSGPATWFWGLVTFIVLYVAFYGALKRNYKFLRFYYVFNVSLYTIMFILTIVSVIYFVATPQDENPQIPQRAKLMNVIPASQNEGSDDAPENDPTVPIPLMKPEKNSNHHHGKGPKHFGFSTKFGKFGQFRSGHLLRNLAASRSKGTNHGQSNSHDNDKSSSSSGEDWGMFVLYFAALLFSMFVFAMKIVSIVLAYKLAALLKAQQQENLAIPTFKTEKLQPIPPSQPVYTPMPQNPTAPYFVAVPQYAQKGVYNPFFYPVQQPLFFQPPAVAPQSQEKNLEQV